MTAAASEAQSVTVEVSADVVILTREQAKFVTSAMTFVRTHHPSADVQLRCEDIRDALVEQVGP